MQTYHAIFLGTRLWSSDISACVYTSTSATKIYHEENRAVRPHVHTREHRQMSACVHTHEPQALCASDPQDPYTSPIARRSAGLLRAAKVPYLAKR